MSYASILRDLKKRVNPDELGATVQGIRETRSKDLLVELKCSTKSRGRLDNAFKEAVASKSKVAKAAQRSPHQDRVGLLQSPQEKGGEAVLPLS